MLLAVWENKDRKDQSNRGVLEMNEEDNRITSFVEKPKEPRSSFAAAPIYLFPRSLVNVPGQYLAQGHNHDAPGFLMEYIVSRYEVRGWRMPGDVIDVGNPESYQRAVRLVGKRKLFSKILNESQNSD